MKFEHNKLYTEYPLWDGKQCGLVEKQCCEFPSLTWFHKMLSIPTTDDIELRLWGDQGTSQ